MRGIFAMEWHPVHEVFECDSWGPALECKVITHLTDPSSYDEKDSTALAAHGTSWNHRYRRVDVRAGHARLRAKAGHRERTRHCKRAA